MKQSKLKKKNKTVFILFSFAVSIALSLLLLFSFAAIVKSNDIRGKALFFFLFAAILPGAIFFTISIQKLTKLRGIVSGLLGGGIISLLYTAMISAINVFCVKPIFYCIIPITIIISLICGILAANTRK